MQYLAAIRTEVIDNIKLVRNSPAVQMQPIPDDALDLHDMDSQRRERREAGIGGMDFRSI